MCGIMGYIGREPAWEIVLSGLRRLEYRGYDSTGIVTVSDKRLRIARRVGHSERPGRSAPARLAGHTSASVTRAGRRTAA